MPPRPAVYIFGEQRHSSSQQRGARGKERSRRKIDIRERWKKQVRFRLCMYNRLNSVTTPLPGTPIIHRYGRSSNDVVGPNGELGYRNL